MNLSVTDVQPISEARSLFTLALTLADGTPLDIRRCALVRRGEGYFTVHGPSAPPGRRDDGWTELVTIPDHIRPEVRRLVLAALTAAA